MTTAFALLLATAVQPSPADLLRQVRDQYQGLSSFSMRIENQDSSGLFPGRYSQSLKWRRGGRFELVMIPKGHPKVPGFYADGRQVLWIRPGNEWTTGELVPDANTMPGWEVSAGPILGWLQSTHSGRFWLEPPKGTQITWSYGPRTTWRGQDVREIRGRMLQEKRDSTISLFVEPKQKLLLGMEYPLNGKSGSAEYADQQLNPALPADLGETPAEEGKEPARGAPSVRLGTEWQYAGEVRRQLGTATAGNARGERQGEPSVKTFTASALVTGLTDGRPEVVRFRQLDGAGFPGESGALWVTAAEGPNEPLPRGLLASMEMRLVDGLNLPAPFGAGMKPGETAITRSPLFGYGPPFPQTLPLRLRAAGEEMVEGRACLRIERTAATRLPLGLTFLRLLDLREQFWIERESGAVVKYEGTARVQDRGDPAVSLLTATLRLKEVREIPQADLKQRREEARQLMAAADLLASRFGEPGEVRVKEAQAQLQRFQRDAPRSPYMAAATSLEVMVNSYLGQARREQELVERQSALVGKAAPAVRLKDLSGKERTLGEYRGKVILLNAFASW
jgi:hypothetical protein